jgi:hypothetical protein
VLKFQARIVVGNVDSGIAVGDGDSIRVSERKMDVSRSECLYIQVSRSTWWPEHYI